MSRSTFVLSLFGTNIALLRQNSSTEKIHLLWELHATIAQPHTHVSRHHHLTSHQSSFSVSNV